MNNKKKIILSVLVALLLLTIGVTYAFFTYENIGQKSEVVTGQIYMNYEETSTISLTGVFPETKEQALARQDENGVFEFTITGRNTSKNPVYYEIDLLEGGLITGVTESSTKILPEHVKIYLERDGEVLIDGKTYNDWNNRRVFVETIPANQTTNIEHKYILRMWIDENVTISNTNPNADYTTTEWNTAYTSLKVRVVGDFNPKELPGTMARLGSSADGAFWEESIINVKANIKEVNFIQLENSEIDTRFDVATIKSDVSTSEEYPIKAWLEVNENDATKYTMYVASEEEIYFPNDSSLMFAQFTGLENINFENVKTSLVTNIMGMFLYCTGLTSIDLSGLDTGNVTNMSSLFMACTGLTSIDLSSLDTRNVTNMSGIFLLCIGLTSLDLSSLDTRNVTNMSGMFTYCTGLTSLDLSGFDTSQVTEIWGMFTYCTGLTSLDLSGFDTSQVIDMSEMFSSCTSLTSLDLSGWDTSSVTNMYAVFSKCNSLTEIIGIENLETDKVESLAFMFNKCTKLESLDLSGWDTSQVTTMSSMFQECSSLTEIIGIENFETDKVESLDFMFNKCTKLKSLDLSGWDTSQVTIMNSMFQECSSLTEIIGIENFETDKVKTLAFMFNRCKSLTGLDLSTWNMSNVEDTGTMFQYVSKATEIKLPDNVKVIGDFMFNHNYAHTGETFTIPASVTTLGKTHMWYSFGTSFKEFIVADGNTNFKTIDGILYSMDGTRLVSVPTKKTFTDRTFTIPEGVTFIGESNFSTNKNIDTLVLPDSYVITRYVGKSNENYNSQNVNYGNSLFLGIYYRTNISEYVVNDTNPNYISVDGCIYSKDGSELIAVPWQYNGALNIKEGTTTIGQEAFSTQGAASSETTKLTSVHIPASVTTIESAQLTALNKLVGRITITIDEANPNYTITDGKIVAK